MREGAIDHVVAPFVVAAPVAERRAHAVHRGGLVLHRIDEPERLEHVVKGIVAELDAARRLEHEGLALRAEHGDGSVRQRHLVEIVGVRLVHLFELAMRGRDRPYLRVKIELAPIRREGLVGAGAAQRQQFERTGRRRVVGRELRPEGRHVFPRHAGVRNLRGWVLGEMVAHGDPRGRVRAHLLRPEGVRDQAEEPGATVRAGASPYRPDHSRYVGRGQSAAAHMRDGLEVGFDQMAFLAKLLRSPFVGVVHEVVDDGRAEFAIVGASCARACARSGAPGTLYATM